MKLFVMNQVKHGVAALCTALLVTPMGFGADLVSRSDRNPVVAEKDGFINRLTHNYNPAYIPPIDISNSGRLDQLIRAGNLYLSLNDAIALALENNIGLEIQRYQFQLADVGLLTARAGNSGINFDPVINGTISKNENKTINTNALLGGGAPITITNGQTKNFNVQQGFETGGNLQLSFNNGLSQANNYSNAFIPQYTSSLQLQGTQPLLNGFGIALNTRGIRIAKNNIRLSDFQFQQNINSTLNTVIQAYWNLQAAVLNVDVVRASLTQAQKLLSDDRKQFDIGTMAAIDVTQAEGNVVTGELNVYTAEGTVRSQEVALKNAISRNGIASASLSAVHIIPITRAVVPDVEPIVPMQDLMEAALRNRPEIPIQRIGLENAQINLKATRNNLLPTLNLTGNVGNQGTGGVFNPITFTPGIGGAEGIVNQNGRLLSSVNPGYIGGYTNILRQLFAVPVVGYSIGVTFSVTLRNRSAQAAMIQQELNYRVSETQLQQQINTVRSDVANAQINIDTARQRYTAAVKASAIAAQVLDAEQKKLALGASTNFQVIQYQTQLLTARQNEVSAQVAYVNAKLQMDIATSDLMDKYNIIYDEARAGTLSRRADPIPDVVNAPR